MPATPIDPPGSGGDITPPPDDPRIPTRFPCRIIIVIVSILVCFLTIIVIRFLPFDQETVVLLIRHAEKGTAPADDPPLTGEGETRATELVRVAGGAGIQKIYASEFVRTQKTVEPLGLAIGQPVDTNFHSNNAAGLVNDILANHRGQTVLAAHHSPSVPEIIQRLGGGNVPPIGENEFDRFYVVHHHRYFGVRVTLLKYGAPPPPP